MPDNRNALAELAEWMDGQVDAFPVMSNQFTEQDMRDRLNARKVQRIVAELAKVGYWKSTGRPHFEDAVSAVSNCRAIAEEK